MFIGYDQESLEYVGRMAESFGVSTERSYSEFRKSRLFQRRIEYSLHCYGAQDKELRELLNSYWGSGCGRAGRASWRGDKRPGDKQHI